MATEEPFATFDDGTLHIDIVQCEVTLDGRPVIMNPKQCFVLLTLVLRHGQPVSTAEILELLWGKDAPKSAAKALQGHISSLRNMLTRQGSRDYPTVETVPGFGYRYCSRP